MQFICARKFPLKLRIKLSKNTKSERNREEWNENDHDDDEKKEKKSQTIIDKNYSWTNMVLHCVQIVNARASTVNSNFFEFFAEK